MPIYDHRCPACATIIEVLSSYEDRDKSPNCTKCNNIKTERIISFRKSPPPEGGEIYEQVYTNNPDGSTTVEPAAARLKAAHRKIIPPNSSRIEHR